ncbi:MAG: DUF4401 domain-containing protein [Roseiflexaceae bacterium]|nr:DUF4401 domain-containing protein [Roseiflexaceae bacterium]
MTLESLFLALHGAGRVASPETPAIELQSNHSPWYTRVLLGGMGWLGGMFVLGFMGALVSGLFNNAFAMTVLAVIMFVSSFAIYRIANNNDFGTQFALAASICGQALAAAAFAKWAGRGVDSSSVAWFIALMQVALVWVMPNFLHRLISTMFAVTALFFATQKGGASIAIDLMLGLGFVGLIQYESQLVASKQRALSEPVLNGLAIGLLVVGVAYLDFVGGTTWLPFATMSAIAFGIALMVWVVSATKHLPLNSRGAALGAALAFAAVAWRAPGLIATSLVLLASFAASRRTLTALAMLALMGYLSTYYYPMSLTLLVKAGVLALTGAVLLVLWWVHRQYFSSEAAS